jgi:hypothetical protein
VHGCGKGVRKARACLYRLGRRRGSGVRANWPSMAMAAGPALMEFKGEEGVTDGGKEGRSGVGAPMRLDDGN